MADFDLCNLAVGWNVLRLLLEAFGAIVRVGRLLLKVECFGLGCMSDVFLLILSDIYVLGAGWVGGRGNTRILSDSAGGAVL